MLDSSPDRSQQLTAELRLKATLATDLHHLPTVFQLGMIYLQTNRNSQAIDLFRDLTAHAPHSPEAWYGLGKALFLEDDYAGAVHAYQRVLQLYPNHPKALADLAMSLCQMMELDRCLEVMEQAAAMDPTPESFSHLLVLSMYYPNRSVQQLVELANRWDARFAAPIQPSVVETQRDPQRPLRVGYVAPSFRMHPVGVLIEPVIARHDRARFAAYCYSDVREPDHVTDRFRYHAVKYRDTTQLADEQLTQVIRDDQIDILIDLNLHTLHPRLGVFARRAAPLQVNYLAYPFTGGLRTLDYRVTDAVLDPPGSAALGPEALIRLCGCFWLYRPDPAAPEPPRRLPARSAGRFTFASLNFPHKFNAQVATLWASILNQVPRSRLVLFSDRPAGQSRYLGRHFANAGLDPSRIELVGIAPHAQHLARYLQVDLCLDPFPYGGHTTSLDALWMGVPVLTLAGPAPFSRAAASMLSRLGLTELITHSPEEYQALAIALAGNRSRLEALRLGLRERMRKSILCDEAAWVADYERGLRLAWQRYCQGLPPAEIDLSP